MAIINETVLNKGSVNIITLNKSLLLELAESKDEYFGDSLNVKYCVVKLQSVNGRQQRTLKFNLDGISVPTTSVTFSDRARGPLILKSISLYDFDNGKLTLNRNDLTQEPEISIQQQVLDADGDGLLDSQEVELGTNPSEPDSDGDNVNDGLEVELGTNPLNPDTDSDGNPDNTDPDPLQTQAPLLDQTSFTLTVQEDSNEYSSAENRVVICSAVNPSTMYEVITPLEKGSVTFVRNEFDNQKLNLRYQPYANLYGSETFTIRAVLDGFPTETAQVTVNINEVNDFVVVFQNPLPTVTVTPENPSVVVDLSSFIDYSADSELEEYRVALVGEPLLGYVEIDGFQITYTTTAVGSATTFDSFLLRVESQRNGPNSEMGDSESIRQYIELVGF